MKKISSTSSGLSINQRSSDTPLCLPWVASDENGEENWITYLERSLSLSCGSSPFQDSGWSYMHEQAHPTDQELHDELHRLLYQEEGLDSSLIKVTVSNRNVLLTGEVKTSQEVLLAETVVNGHTDVWHTENQLKVKAIS